MSTPAPSGSRGEIALQPNYFTSSIFVESLRSDIAGLIDVYHQQLTNDRSTEPFLLFKSLWASQGWQWIHFMVFDGRARETFLSVVLRLFTECLANTNAPKVRAIALFGLYTFFYTQPRGTAPPLYSIDHIALPLDHFEALKALPSSLDGSQLQSLRPHVSYILSILLKEKVFFVIPSSSLGSLNPRHLPREIFVKDAAPLLDPRPPKKKGRPTKRDKAVKARLALDNLERWLEATPYPQTITAVPPSPYQATATTAHHPVAETLRQYQYEKSLLMEGFDTQSPPPMVIESANQFVLGRLKATENLFETDTLSGTSNASTGTARVERAVKELGDSVAVGRKGGALYLLEGAGRTEL